jgi:hypothetical protein
MSNRTVRYTSGEIGRVRVVEDFLPRPADLVPHEDNVKVSLSLSLSRRSLDFFRREAKKRRVPYQRMISALVDTYAEKQAGGKSQGGRRRGCAAPTRRSSGEPSNGVVGMRARSRGHASLIRPTCSRPGRRNHGEADAQGVGGNVGGDAFNSPNDAQRNSGRPRGGIVCIFPIAFDRIQATLANPR